MHAGLYHPSALQTFAIARLTCILLSFVAIFWCATSGILPTRLAWPLGAISAGMFILLPSYWLDRRKHRRQTILSRSLPDFFDLVVTCLESGLSLEAALQRVTMELRFAHPVLAAEMERVQQEIDLGTTASGALQNLADRSDLEAIRSLGSFVKQATKLGSSITEALRTHAEMMRAQREQRAEELAQKAAVKVLFPTLLLIFPTVFVVLAGPAVIQLREKFSNESSKPTRSVTK
jgi:tight adherence protein C